MPKCDRCGAFMDPAATACAWCGAGGDNGSAASFSVPTSPVEHSVALAGAAAASNAVIPSLTIDPLSTEQKDLNGIGGWLTLAAVNLVLAPMGLLYALGWDLVLLMGGQIPGPPSSRPAITGLLLFDAISDLILLAVLIVLNIFFYGKRKSFSRWYITFLAVSFILMLAIHQMMLSYLPTYPSIVAFGSFVSASGWIPYFLRSERVKQTFVN